MHLSGFYSLPLISFNPPISYVLETLVSESYWGDLMIDYKARFISRPK